MRRSLLLIAASFAAGLGLGYVLKPAPAPDRARRTVPSAPGPAAGGAGVSRAGASPHSDPITPLPEGDGRIRGRVVDDAGAPIEGALVVAVPMEKETPAKWRKGAAGPLDQDLDELARETAARWRWMREGRRTARTGADGTYEVTGLGPIQWQMHAYKEDYHLQPSAGNAYGAEPGATVDFAGGRVVRVDVDVRLPDASRPTKATIRALVQTTQRGSSSTNETWLAEEPWIELRPQTYELTAMTETAKSQPQTVTIEVGRTQPLTFQLEGRPGLRVSVMRPADLSVPDLEVMALRFAERLPDHARLREEGSRMARHRREDTMTWQDLEPGSYLIGAAYSHDDPITVTKVVEVTTGMAEHELRLPPVDPKDYLVVRVRDPEGSSPSPLQFYLDYRSPRRTSGRGVNALRRADGAYLLRRPAREEDGADGRYSIGAECPLGRVEQVFDPADTREILIRFEPPAFVDVTIPAYARSPHAGWLGLALAVRDERGRSNRVNGNKPQPQGTCRLGPVQPGRYELVLHASPESWAVAVQPIELRSGDQAAAIDVPALHTLTIRWPGKGTCVFGIWRKDIPSARLRREITEESTTIERMAPGLYEIRAYGSENKAIDVEVPRQAEITLP